MALENPTYVFLFCDYKLLKQFVKYRGQRTLVGQPLFSIYCASQQSSRHPNWMPFVAAGNSICSKTQRRLALRTHMKSTWQPGWEVARLVCMLTVGQLPVAITRRFPLGYVLGQLSQAVYHYNMSLSFQSSTQWIVAQSQNLLWIVQSLGEPTFFIMQVKTPLVTCLTDREEFY